MATTSAEPSSRTWTAEKNWPSGAQRGRRLTLTEVPAAGSTSQPSEMNEMSTARASTGSPSTTLRAASRKASRSAERTLATVPAGKAPSGAWSSTITPLPADMTRSMAGASEEAVSAGAASGATASAGAAASGAASGRATSSVRAAPSEEPATSEESVARGADSLPEACSDEDCALFSSSPDVAMGASSPDDGAATATARAGTPCVASATESTIAAASRAPRCFLSVRGWRIVVPSLACLRAV